MPTSNLAGRSILIVEDEYFIASDLRRELAGAGADVIGPAPTLEKALALIAAADTIDGAVLDINLGGEPVFPVADLLRDRGVPFLFATGYDQSMVPPRFDDVTRCEKPFGAGKVSGSLATLM